MPIVGTEGFFESALRDLKSCTSPDLRERQQNGQNFFRLLEAEEERLSCNILKHHKPSLVLINTFGKVPLYINSYAESIHTSRPRG